MRAVTVREYGGSPAVAEIPTPEPGARQILIRLRAAGMNPMDLRLASGAWKPMPARFPMVLGADGAGVVEKLGEGTSRYVADEEALRRTGVTGINFALQASSELFERVAQAVADGRILAPPITRVSLEEALAAPNPAQARPAGGKTVITL